MGAEAGIALLAIVYVVGTLAFFVRLCVSAFRAPNDAIARTKVYLAVAISLVISIAGGAWWAMNYPPHLSPANVLLFCTLPGLGVGAIAAEIAVRLMSRTSHQDRIGAYPWARWKERIRRQS